MPHLLSILTVLSNLCELCRGVVLVYLPPYSPDFNPIELAFSSIKAHIRSNDALFRTLMTDDPTLQLPLILALIDAVYTVTPEKARAWFRHCNYVN